jgi:signal transduction histidine kinase
LALRSLITKNPTEELAPRIVLLLDGDGFAVSAKCKRAETETEAEPGFHKFTDFRGISVHEFLHSDCAGDCGFEEMWNDARNQLQQRDFAEWELNDQILDRLLRFNLTRLPSPREGEIERRRRNALLTIRDITKYRKAHESLRQREEELMTLVRQQGLELASAQSRLEKDGKAHQDDQTLLAEFDEKIRSLGQSVIVAQENERKRIASDLHDGIAQSLMALKFSIEASIEALAAENKDLDLRTLENAADQIKGTVE